MAFGGAITEASAYAYSLLPKEKQLEFLNEYFSNLHYSICRIPIGSSDFSLSSYSYSNLPNLSDFSIQRDKKFLIPFIHEAQKTNPNIQFFATPWSPPAFMKTNRSLFSGGKLLNKFKASLADYLAKYVKAYQEENISISFMSIQNEPNASQTWESCNFTAMEEYDFLIHYLYPTFMNNNLSTKFFIWDHNKEKLLERAISELKLDEALDCISGVAFHFYTGDHFENIKILNELFPDKLYFHTEGCTGYSNFRSEDEVHNAEIYAHDIIGDLNSGTNSYIDWNLLLDYNGGPNHKNNFCNSPIMLTKDNQNFQKNLSFYYIAHFSKFIKPNAKRIAFSRYTNKIELTAFQNADNSIAVILLNCNDINKEYSLCLGDFVIKDNLDSHAIVSYLIQY